MQLLTLATVRERYWTLANQTVPFASATQAQLDDATFRINQVCENFINSGKWLDMLRRITLPIYDGYITLPRELQTCLGISVIRENGCRCITTIYSRFHEFAHGGCGCCSNISRPVSDTAQTFITPDAPFYLRVKGTVSESKTISFIGGWDEDENEIFTTETLTIINGSATTTQQYSSLPQTGGIQKQVTSTKVELYSVDSSGTETLIAVYGPNETVPAYKKYAVPDWDGQFTTASILGKLAYVEAVEDSDIIIPSHWGALKLGLKALRAEDTEEDDEAAKDWARAYERLNSQLEESEGDAEYPVFRVAQSTGCEGIFTVI